MIVTVKNKWIMKQFGWRKQPSYVKASVSLWWLWFYRYWFKLDTV